MRRLYYKAKAACRRLNYQVIRARLNKAETVAYKLKTRQLVGASCSDAIILSYPKSGRTWIETMLSHLFVCRLALSETRILDFQEDRSEFPLLPYLFFTHDYAHTGQGQWLIPKSGSRRHFWMTPTLFIVRHPIDTAVSMYFHQLKRERNFYDVGLYEYVSSYEGGLSTVMEFMNFWLKESANIERHRIVRYEDLSADTFSEFSSIVQFFGLEFDENEIRNAVAFSDFKNLQKLEKAGQLSDWRFSEGGETDNDRLKVRRGKIGGYKDYFDVEQVAALEKIVVEELDAQFGY